MSLGSEHREITRCDDPAFATKVMFHEKSGLLSPGWKEYRTRHPLASRVRFLASIDGIQAIKLSQSVKNLKKIIDESLPIQASLRVFTHRASVLSTSMASFPSTWTTGKSGAWS